MVSYADSHVHLADDAFAVDVDAVVERARAAGARALVCIGDTRSDAIRAQALSVVHPGFVFHTCGVHPHHAAEWDPVRDSEAIQQAAEHGAVAVGECGLDYHYDIAPRAQQRGVLEAHLALAQSLALPIVLHTRDAEEDTLAFLADAASAGVGGVLHCFTGSVSLAEKGLEAGWFVSFSGITTFKSWTDETLLRTIPDDRILVESDGPYLAPVPHRGKRNESAFVPLTLARLASVRGTSAQDLGSTALANTRRLFSLPNAFADNEQQG